MMKNNLSVKEAAELMGASIQFIRIGLRKGVLPFGTAVQLSGKKYTYHISRHKFNEYMGIEEN